MRSGRAKIVVGQVGEYAVSGVLGKCGLIATPFAGNIPGFDVLVVDDKLNCLPIQVKTSSGSQWITGAPHEVCGCQEGRKAGDIGRNPDSQVSGLDSGLRIVGKERWG